MPLLKNYIILAIVIAVLIILYNYFKQTSKKYYNLARKYHKLGEKHHNQGDDKLAEEYYEDATLFRKKAEELENVV